MSDYLYKCPDTGDIYYHQSVYDKQAEEIQRLQKLADRRGQLLRMIWDGPIESLTQAEAEPPQEQEE